MSIFKDQFDVMTLAGQTATRSSEMSNIDDHSKQLSLYASLIAEEYHEFRDEIMNPSDSVEDIKECVDILVVAAG